MMLKLNDGRNELWQWDTGRRLTVDAECSEVHFSNKVYGRSIDVAVIDGTAAIPDILLQVDKELYAWGFVGTPENGYTKISKVFRVNRRNKPQDYVFTPPDQTTLAGIMEELNKLKEVVSPEKIGEAVNEYLEENPITPAEIGAVAQNQGQEHADKILGIDAAGEVVPVDKPSGGTENAVTYTEQEPSEEEQAQARENIDAAQKPLIVTFTSEQTDTGDYRYFADCTYQQVMDAAQSGREVKGHSDNAVFPDITALYGISVWFELIESEYLPVFKYYYFSENKVVETYIQIEGTNDVFAWSTAITIPANTSDLNNDSGFITNIVSDLANYYAKKDIDKMISTIPKFAIAVVDALPTSDISTTTVYLVRGGSGTDLYTEYIYVDGEWEILGSQRVDLTGYATETWVIGKLADYVPVTELQSAINTALAQAKESGEFDGEDGTSVTITNTTESTEDGGENVVEFSDGNKMTVRNGKTGAQGDPGVYVGSEDTMPKGTIVRIDPDGEAMELVEVDDTLKRQGYAADAKVTGEKLSELSEAIAEQQTAIDEKQPKGDYVKTVNGQTPDTNGNVIVTAQAEQPNFVDSVEEMTDTAKAYVLKTDGMIYTYSKKTTVVPGSNVNVFDKSTATINGRLNSSGTAASATTGSKGCFITDFIELTNWGSLSTFMVRVNFELQSMSIDANQAYFYDESQAFISPYAMFVSHTDKITIGDGKTSFDLKQMFSDSSAKYVKLRLYKNVSGTAIATTDLDDVEILFDANETPETVVDTWGWYSTGLSYSQSDNEERIASLENNVNDNTVDIALLKGRVSSLENGEGAIIIPDWWEDEVADTIAKIKVLQVGRNCVTFPFFSDNHQRNGYAGVLIAKVMKECGIPYAFFGGDTISSGYIADEATMIAQDKAFDDVMSYIPNGKFCRAVGNHDGYWAVSSTEKYGYTRPQVYELFLRAEGTEQNKHFGGDGTYYFVDDMPSKVRWIVLDSNSQPIGAGNENFDADQLSWLQNTALKFNENGWAVIIISHCPVANPYHANVTNATEVINIIKNYKNSTDTNKADIIGWYSGHIHRDRIFTNLYVNGTSEGYLGEPDIELGFTQVTITSDNTYIAYGELVDGVLVTSPTKHPVDNSDQSHAIDFVTVNRDTRTVNITRLGIGEDRSYTY